MLTTCSTVISATRQVHSLVPRVHGPRSEQDHTCRWMANGDAFWFTDQRYGLAAHWWTFGVLTYEMLPDQSPSFGNEPLYPITMPRRCVNFAEGRFCNRICASSGFGEGWHWGNRATSFLQGHQLRWCYEQAHSTSLLPNNRNPRSLDIDLESTDQLSHRMARVIFTKESQHWYMVNCHYRAAGLSWVRNYPKDFQRAC